MQVPVRCSSKARVQLQWYLLKMHLEVQLPLFLEMRHALLPRDQSSPDEQWQHSRSGELALDPAQDRQKEGPRKTKDLPQEYDEMIIVLYHHNPLYLPFFVAIHHRRINPYIFQHSQRYFVFEFDF